MLAHNAPVIRKGAIVNRFLNVLYLHVLYAFYLHYQNPFPHKHHFESFI